MEGEITMVSFWWIVAAFVGGGFAGMLLIALMVMASDEAKQLAHMPDLDVTQL